MKKNYCRQLCKELLCCTGRYCRGEWGQLQRSPHAWKCGCVLHPGLAAVLTSAGVAMPIRWTCTPGVLQAQSWALSIVRSTSTLARLPPESAIAALASRCIQTGLVSQVKLLT